MRNNRDIEELSLDFSSPVGSRAEFSGLIHSEANEILGSAVRKEGQI